MNDTVKGLPEKWRKNARELGRSSDPDGIWNSTLNDCADALDEAISEHDEDERVEKLQRALNFWLPTCAQVPGQFAERVREDACLLMGFTGPGVNEPCFHDLASEDGESTLASVGASGEGLPEPVGLIYLPSLGEGHAVDVPAYTEEQMRAYGEQCRRPATAEQPGSAVQGEALADAIRSIPVPTHGFHKGWRDEEIWEWALREAAKLVTTPPPAPAAEQGKCEHCEDDGVYATDGSGPFDCYACGKKVTQPEARGVEGK